MAEKLQKAYKEILGDHFPQKIEIKFEDTIFRYEKIGWDVGGEIKGLRYGENPGQEAALYKLVNGNLAIGEVKTIQPGRWLASNAELLQSGKHPGKINITDADNALNILRYFMDEPVVAIMKHNNPCGVAIGRTLIDAYKKANLADRVAAFGGTIALNRSVDRDTARAIIENYSEVVVAPEYEEGVMGIFSYKKNLRVMKIENMSKLKEWVGEVVIDFKSLIDGGLILQTSYVPKARTLDDIKALPLGYHDIKEKIYKIERAPTEQEYKNMWFGWLVESGISSNSVIYVKDGVTVGIGTGEQDRVGAAEIARDKAYTKARDRICFQRYGMPYNELILKLESPDTDSLVRPDLELYKDDIEKKVKETKAGLIGATAVSDAFYPFRDGVDVALREGVNGFIQPGGSERDFESIIACNEAKATMVYTKQRSFKH